MTTHMDLLTFQKTINILAVDLSIWNIIFSSPSRNSRVYSALDLSSNVMVKAKKKSIMNQVYLFINIKHTFNNQNNGTEDIFMWQQI